MNESAASSESAEPIERFAGGDRRAFDELYALHARELLSYLVARLRDESAAEDVLQDVWRKAWQNRTQFTDGSFRAWVFSIARTTLIDAVRKKRRQNEVSDNDDWAGATVEGDGLATIVRTEELQAFRDCLESTGGVFVQAVRMVSVEERSTEEVTATLDVAKGTLYTRVSRGKQQLKDCVEQKLK